jgi:hypothetical protein
MAIKPQDSIPVYPLLAKFETIGVTTPDGLGIVSAIYVVDLPQVVIGFFVRNFGQRFSGENWVNGKSKVNDSGA